MVPEIPEILTGRMLPIYQELFEIVEKLSTILINVVNQIHCLTDKTSKINSERVFSRNLLKKCGFIQPFEVLGNTLLAILTLDTLIRENVNILKD